MGPVEVVRHCVALLATHRGRFVAYVLLVCGQTAFYCVLPVIYSRIFDVAIPQQDLAYLGVLAGLLCALFLLVLLTEWGDTCLIARMTADGMQDLRRRLYEHLQRLPLGYFLRTSTGDLLGRFSADLGHVEQALAVSFYRVLFHVVTLIAATGMLFYFEWRLALIILLSFPLGFLGPKLFGARAEGAAAQRKQEEAGVLGAVQESVLAQKVLRAFALQAEFLDRFLQRLGSLHRRSESQHRATQLVGRSSSAGVLLIQFIVLLTGAWLTIIDYLSPGILVGFLVLLSGMGNSARVLASTVPELVQAGSGMQRIHELLAEPLDRPDAERSESLPSLTREIRFDDVTFAYSDDNVVLDGLSFAIEAGQSVAFVGRSGSGKSTVLNLVTRFYEARDGQITVDGRDLRQVTEAHLRGQVGVVFQDAFLFNTTIRENIRLGRLDATDAEVEAAAKAAEIDGFVRSLPEGYDTPVGEQGGRLSGGQRQRVALARAILRSPSILVLDEVTSALDPATEAAINATLERLSADRTVISVTHRLTSAVNLDRIFVLDAGRLVEQGTHRELLNLKGLYYQMWQDFTLEMTQDAVVGDVDEAPAADLVAPERTYGQDAEQRLRDAEQALQQTRREAERLRAINHRWAQLAGTDRLTELPNKLAFLQALLPQEIQQAHRDGVDLGLLLISGDNLGLINDSGGRQAGDRAIVELAGVLRSMLKGEELLAHLDGTYFAVVLTGADEATMATRAEQVRSAVEAHDFAVAADVGLTVSIGTCGIVAAQAPDGRQAAEEALERLSTATFAAKRAGGNRVERAA